MKLVLCLCNCQFYGLTQKPRTFATCVSVAQLIACRIFLLLWVCRFFLVSSAFFIPARVTFYLLSIHDFCGANNEYSLQLWCRSITQHVLLPLANGLRDIYTNLPLYQKKTPHRKHSVSYEIRLAPIRNHH